MEKFSQGDKKNVRLAGPGDEEKLYQFVCDGHLESAIFSLSESRIRTIIRNATEHNANHLVIIGVIDSPEKDKIVASLAIEYAQPWYSEDWFLSELWNNVHADCRQSHYARDLMAFGKSLADETGRPLSMGIITTDRMEPKIALYKRKMPQVGAYFMHNLSKCKGPAMMEVADGRR